MGLPEIFMMKSPEPSPEAMFLWTHLWGLIEGMDIPKHRRQDAPWLVRNMGIRNGGHPNFEEALKTAKELML